MFCPGPVRDLGTTVRRTIKETDPSTTALPMVLLHFFRLSSSTLFAHNFHSQPSPICKQRYRVFVSSQYFTASVPYFTMNIPTTLLNHPITSSTDIGMETMKSPKSVKFASVVNKRAVLHLKDYSKDEIQAVFYSPKEIQDMKGEVDSTVQRMKLNKRIDEVKYSVRGVECSYTKEALKSCSKRKRAARHAVFTAQERTREKNHMIRQQERLRSLLEEKKKVSKGGRRLSSSSLSSGSSSSSDSSHEGIAKAYSIAVKESAFLAYKIGLIDEQFVLSEEARLLHESQKKNGMSLFFSQKPSRIASLFRTATTTKTSRAVF